MPKRKRKPQNKQKYSRHKSKSEERDSKVDVEKISPVDSIESEDDCELITLRLNALKSKQEFKEPEQEDRNVDEEELLRIDALKSALLKKRDHFMEKKRRRKIEKERPYSPTDDLDLELEILEDDPMELSPPIQSPDINQMDMEISESSNSSTPIVQTDGPNDLSDEDEEEKALRSMLLSSISNRRKAEEKNVALNLKLAVERLRQAQHKPSLKIQPPKKSGTKTIKMILEEKKNRKTDQKPHDLEEQLLLSKINNEQNEVIEKLPIPPVVEETIAAENHIFLPTISDTKNIPLIASENDTSSAKKSRILTSLIKKPVEPLIINLNDESSDDDIVDGGLMTKKDIGTAKSHQINVIEKQVECILRKIRLQSEKNASEIHIQQISLPIADDLSMKQEVKFAASAVGHLPKSAQIEYAMLMQKMKTLEETISMRQKSRQLKRQRSMSKNEKEIQMPQVKQQSDIKKSKKSLASERIEETINKIQLLDEAARERFALSAENKYLVHSTNLKTATEELIKVINANSLEIKRREKVDSKIVELERQLAKFKSMKKIVDQRINVGIPQIVKSQNTLIRLRNHQHNFGNMCSRVRGSTYR
jgi:hypothetical protein